VKKTLGVLAAIIGLCGLALAIYARYVEPFHVRVRHVTFQVPRKHAHLDGLRIAFVTDTHVGPHFSAKNLDPIVREMERLKPDLVLFGGDYISESPRYIDGIVEPIARIAAAGKLGAYSVLGNHDISNVRTRVSTAVQNAEIRVLANESARIGFGGGDLWVVGIDDALLGRPNLTAAFSEVPADAPSIALWHEPDLAAYAAPFGPLLQLSGHTHGGQIRIPGVGEIAVPKLGRQFPDGRYEIEDMTLIVSRGIGIYRPPVRLNCPPEVLVIHIVA
jgi:predicted MPP superfamily phosphohydrolase